MEQLLLERRQRGDYDKVTTAKAFAQTLTDDLASVAHDLHMKIEYRATAIPPEPEASAAAPRVPASPPQPALMKWIDALGRRMASFGVKKVERLRPDIGYLELAGFARPELAAPKYAKAMADLSDTGVMIVDLRRNRGGSPAGVQLMASYFVDRRMRLNDIHYRDTGRTEQYWTLDKLDGPRYLGKVYILTSRDTRSAGEDFAYTMQAMGRATIVGERTWGGAHPTSAHRLAAHFVGWIPNGRSISPITHTNWEGSGVVPDIPTGSQDALRVVKKRILSDRLAHATTPMAKVELREMLEEL
jgi:C-terminal processing protease CtpA/Prc